MYGYTMRMPAPIEVYEALHRAITEIVGDQGVDGLVLPLAYPTEQGFDLTEVWESKRQLEEFNRTVLPQAMIRTGLSQDGPQPEVVEFDPVGILTPRVFSSDRR